VTHEADQADVPTPRRLPLKERYALLTRGLDWEPSYVSKEWLFPYTRYEGIKIADWDGWGDPFRLTAEAYCRCVDCTN
jgi:phenol hydroxylase P3 protein